MRVRFGLGDRGFYFLLDLTLDVAFCVNLAIFEASVSSLPFVEMFIAQ